MSSKAKGSGQSGRDLGLARGIRHVIEVAFGVGIGEIDSWWYYPLLNNLDTDCCLSGTGTADKVSRH